MDYKSLLNDEQFLPVTTTEGAVLVLAGAGSGKTRVLTYRIAYLLEQCGVNPFNILAITFTNKATNEMKERIKSVTGTDGIWVSTFHGFCSRVLREDINKLGYGKNFTIYSSEDSDRLLTRLIKAESIDDSSFKGLLRWHISNAKSANLTPSQYAASCTDQKVDLIIKLFSLYENELREANALDFDDLLVKTLQLFSEFREVLAKYQERFKYIHVDEFQDTNAIQYCLIKMLGARWKNIFVVGDDDQSIYGWRGAEIANIRNFKKVYPECKVFKLEQNYRSSANILKCANAVIDKNTDRLGKTLWTKAGEGAKVLYNSSYDDRSEADFVLKQIYSLCEHNDYRYSDFAILTRVNSITRAFEEKLNLYNMPYKIYGGFKFYERKEVKDILAYLRMLSNPQDTDAILRIINFPKRGIGEAAVVNFRQTCREAGVGFLDGILNLGRLNISRATATKFEPFARTVNDFREKLVEKPLGNFVEYMVKTLEFDCVYDIDVEEDASKLHNISELVGSIKQFEKDNPSVTLDEYLGSVALISDTDNIAEDNYITIATIHAVKGLEFRCVFVVGCEENIFPNSRALQDPSEMAEERRVMYVAITRAKERLYLTNAQQRYRYGKYENNFASRFILESGLISPSDAKNKEIFATGVNKSDYRPNASSYLGNAAYESSQQVAYGKDGNYGGQGNYSQNSENQFGNKWQNSSYAQNASSAKSANNYATTKIEKANSKDLSVFVAGVAVYHKTFGEGKIIQVSGEVAHIGFPKLGVKQFNLRLAPLEIIK